MLIGTLAAAALYQQGGGGGSGLETIAIAVVVSAPVLAAIALIGAPEPRDRSRRRVSWSEGIAALSANAPFRRLLLAYFVNGSANALPCVALSVLRARRARRRRGDGGAFAGDLFSLRRSFRAVLGMGGAARLEASGLGLGHALRLRHFRRRAVPRRGAISSRSASSAFSQASPSAPISCCRRRCRPMSSTSTPRRAANSGRGSISQSGQWRRRLRRRLRRVSRCGRLGQSASKRRARTPRRPWSRSLCSTPLRRSS